ncbi:MAG TPA: hypothetical protein VJN92_15565 [Candidatus Acidoferrum sp.]|nr:hypothetical protein [Candidatus Acidoferrum sp.]
MKITVKVNEFKRLLEEARAVIPKKPIPSSLVCVKVDVNDAKQATLSASNLTMSIFQAFEVVDGDTGSFLLHAKEAHAFLKRHKDGTATVEVDAKHVTIKIGQASMKIKAMAVDQFPALESMPEVKYTFSLKFFKRILAKVEAAVPDKAGRHSVPTVKIESDGSKLRAVASDGYRIAIADAPCDGGVFELQIQKMCLPVFKRREGAWFHFAESDTNFFFRTEGVVLSIRKPQTKFPPVQKALSMANFKTEFKISAGSFKEALRQVETTVHGKVPGIHLMISEQGLRLKSADDEGGESETQVPAAVTGTANSTRLNLQFIDEFLSQAEGDVLVQFIDRNSLVKFSNGPNYIYLVMPLLPDKCEEAAEQESTSVSV